MATTRTHKLTFGKMEVSIKSHTEKPSQMIELEIRGIEDAAKVASEPGGPILVDERLIDKQYRDAVKLIVNELGAVAKAHGCEDQNMFPVAGVRHLYHVPKEKIMLASLRAGPELKKEETGKTRAAFDAMQKKLDEIAPEIEQWLAISKAKKERVEAAPPYLRTIIDGHEDFKARLKKDIIMIAPEIEAHNIDVMVSYVEEQIKAASQAKTPSRN